ncbi:MAG: hypothetical protein Q9181_000153 [Wetmoreana brouardii]
MQPKWSTRALAVLATPLLTANPVAASGAATFVSSDSDNNLTFSINIPGNPQYPNDFAFYLSAPHDNSWVGVGFGEEMKNAFMLIAYTSKNDKRLTLSPRVGNGHVEPSYYKNNTMSIDLNDDTGIKDGRYVVHGLCRNCKDYISGSIDFNSTEQPMIYALGPDQLYLSSNAKDAGLRRHDYFGTFTMNLQAAKGDPAQFPPKDLFHSKDTRIGEKQNDHEYSSSLHAIAMAGTFVVIFPVGVFHQKVLRTIRWHWITQAFGVIVVLVGAGLGLGMSQTYNRVNNEGSVNPDLLADLAASLNITTAPIKLSGW